MTVDLRADLQAELMPLALGHDQEASACPWVQLTRRTAAYPSRIAQAALLLASGAVSPTPGLVDQIYRCDDCGRCRAHALLPGPPDLPRALWRVRSSLVAAAAVPELLPLAAALREHGSIYGDIRVAFGRLGAGDAGAGVLFVPGAATLFYEPDSAVAALEAVRSVCGRADLSSDAMDSGHVARELGLTDEASAIGERVRRRVAEAGYRLVVTGTPKETFGLRETLAGLPTEVRYAGGLVAGAGGVPEAPAAGADAVVFHPSETLLHRLDEFDAIDRWLSAWLGGTYAREADPARDALPAAIERPAIRVPASLARALAAARMAQLQKIGGASSGRRLILTCDPFSARALREVAPPGIEVMDLLLFAFGKRREEEGAGA
ncbi:MAG: hypothetical protein ACRDJH_26280 [Thermomicrobiales bacterium]